MRIPEEGEEKAAAWDIRIFHKHNNASVISRIREKNKAAILQRAAQELDGTLGVTKKIISIDPFLF